MAVDREAHRHLVPFPERGTALDVGEEKGDGAGWELSHGVLAAPSYRHSDSRTVD